MLATAFASMVLLPLYGCGSKTSANANETLQSENANAPGRFGAAMKPLVIDAPFYFDAPYSISDDKTVPPESYVALYVRDGRMYMKVNVSESKRRELLAKAVEIYNEKHPDTRIAIGAEAESEFVRSGWIGAPFGGLESTLLSYRTQADLKYMAGLEIKPANDANDANDVVIWLRALTTVADPDFRRSLTDGRGIILIADASTNFQWVNEVMDNLVYNRIPKVSLLTTEMALYIDPQMCDYSLSSRSFRLECYLTLNWHYVKFNAAVQEQSVESSNGPEEAETSEEELEYIEEPEPEIEEPSFEKEGPDFPLENTLIMQVGGSFPGNAYCNFIVCRDGSETHMPIFNDFDNRGECAVMFLRKYNRNVVSVLGRLAQQHYEGKLTKEDYERRYREVCDDETLVQPVVLIEPRRDATYGAVIAAISVVRAADIGKYGIYRNKKYNMVKSEAL